MCPRQGTIVATDQEAGKKNSFYTVGALKNLLAVLLGSAERSTERGKNKRGLLIRHMKVLQCP